MKRSFSTTTAGKGATYTWEGNEDVGQGGMEIVAPVAPHKVAFKLDFVNPFAAGKSTEVLVCLSRESRKEVDEMIRNAVAGGGTIHAPLQDLGFMYQYGFQDLDGHIWELIYMAPTAGQR